MCVKLNTGCTSLPEWGELNSVISLPGLGLYDLTIPCFIIIRSLFLFYSDFHFFSLTLVVIPSPKLSIHQKAKHYSVRKCLIDLIYKLCPHKLVSWNQLPPMQLRYVHPPHMSVDAIPDLTSDKLHPTRPNKKNCCVALLEITFSGRVGRSEIFFFFFFFTHIPWVKVRAQNRICIANDDNQIVKAIFLLWNQRLKDLTQFLLLNWMIMC